MSSLSERISHVFDGLGTATGSAGPIWQPSEQQVFRGGEFRGGSSGDEDDEPVAIGAADIDLPPDLLDMDGGPDAAPFVPTPEFCRALDREDEYDANDHIAAARDDDGRRPDGSTEVLRRNAYEHDVDSDDETPGTAAQPSVAEEEVADFPGCGEPPLPRSGMLPQAASPIEDHPGPSGRSGKEVAAGLTQSSPLLFQKRQDDAPVNSGGGGGGSGGGGDGGGGGDVAGGKVSGVSSRRNSEDKKRVRFAAYVPPQRRSSIETAPQQLMQTSSGLKPVRPSLKGGQPQSHTGRLSTSTVPLHVVHPEKFDCYELDTPLLVGAGDRQPGAAAENLAPARLGSRVEITEVGPSDMETASPQQSEQPPLPAFGTGIEFRPRSKPDASQRPLASGANAAQASFADECERADDSGSGSKGRGSSGDGAGIGSSGGVRGARGSRGGTLGSHLQEDEDVEDGQRGADDMDLGSPTAAAALATNAEVAGTTAAAAAAGGTGNAGPGPSRRRNYRKAAMEPEQR